jgi:dihydroorotase
MPNTTKPILTARDAVRYREEIIFETPVWFKPLMTIKLVRSTTPEVIADAKDAGVVAGKVYPEGVTTNSDDGVRNVKELYGVFEAMEKAGMILCLHGEVPDAFCLDREDAFLLALEDIATTFPKLKIVLEHITTASAAHVVTVLPANVAATITVHHLFITLDDVIGGMLSPHNFCKPVAKRPHDREALLRAAVSGNPKFFLGTDSAPHAAEKKECASGCAGCFTAPMALPALASIFDREGALNKLEAFTSTFGAEFYGLPLNEGEISLVKEDWRIPQVCGVVPFMAGKTLSWRLT